MQKKLLAVAVAGALGVPALAMAAGSTVNIYGKITYEYAITNGGQGQPNTDYADTPGGTAIGFKGEEKLGGGLSAWFQCESSADVRAVDQVGFCTRNSAVGFKGAFGNVHFGRWDTPIKKAIGVGYIGGQQTGSFGSSFIFAGGSGGATAIGSAAQNPVSNRNRWMRRETALTYYESPKFSGFQVLAAFSPGNYAADNPAVTTNNKPRVLSLAGLYHNGPLGLALGYEKHKDWVPGTAGAGDDHAWTLSAAYTFARQLKLGVAYLDAKYETGPGTEITKKNVAVGAEWHISGPHNLELQYVHAGDSKGNSTANISDVRAPCTAVGVCPGNTAGQMYSLAYLHEFSKRTALRLIYVRINNDDRATYKLGSYSGVTAGESQYAWGMHIEHRF